MIYRLLALLLLVGCQRTVVVDTQGRIVQAPTEPEVLPIEQLGRFENDEVVCYGDAYFGLQCKWKLKL